MPDEDSTVKPRGGVRPAGESVEFFPLPVFENEILAVFPVVPGGGISRVPLSASSCVSVDGDNRHLGVAGGSDGV